MFAEPRDIIDPSQCYFYHKIDLPGIGTVGGDWDHREDIENYLGQFPYFGKRVLDVGTATGLLTFEMEKRGAEVVSYDIDDGKNWDLVPHYKIWPQMDEMLAERRRAVERMKDGYWYCHKACRSRAKVYYGNIYNLPETLGRFDVSMFGLILTHLRDPFNALYQAARLTDGHMIITGMYQEKEGAPAFFRPNANQWDTAALHSWWLFSLSTLENMLGTLGFKIDKVVKSSATLGVRSDAGPRVLQTIVAHKVRD